MKASLARNGAWDGINFFRGSGGPFFIKGNPFRDIARTGCDLSRDIGGFLTFSLLTLTVAVCNAPCVQRRVRRFDFFNGNGDHFMGRAELAKAPDKVRNAHARRLRGSTRRNDVLAAPKL
jgi:hypothetical protein